MASDGRALARYQAQRAGVPEDLFLALVQQESGFNPNARSSAGAFGYTQVMPATAKSPGFGVAPLRNNSPEENMRFGADYLKAMLNRYGGNVPKALAAYNAGPGRADAWDGSDMGAIPEETRGYIKNITGNSRMAGGGGARSSTIGDRGGFQSLIDTILPPRNSPDTLADEAEINDPSRLGLTLQSLGAAIAAGSQGKSASADLDSIRASFYGQKDKADASKREKRQREAAVTIVGGPNSPLGRALMDGADLNQIMDVYSQERTMQNQWGLQDDQQGWQSGEAALGREHDMTMQTDAFGNQVEMAGVNHGYAMEQQEAGQEFQADQNAQARAQQGYQFGVTSGQADRRMDIDEGQFMTQEERLNRQFDAESERQRTNDIFAIEKYKTEIENGVDQGAAARDLLATRLENEGRLKEAAKVRTMPSTAFSDPAMVGQLETLAAPKAAGEQSDVEKMFEALQAIEALKHGNASPEQIAMAQQMLAGKGGVTVNNNSGNPMPGLSPLGEGMDYRRNPDGTVYIGPNGQTEAVIVPGSKLDLDRQAQESATKTEAQHKDLGAIYKASSMLNAVNDAIGESNALSTGAVGKFTSWLGHPAPGAKLRGSLSTIGANISFDALAAMRAESPTGGALGSITEGELRLLRDTIAPLDPDMGSEKLDKSLNYIKDRYESMIQRVINSEAPQAEKERALALFGVDIGAIQAEPEQSEDGWVRTGSGSYRVKP